MNMYIYAIWIFLAVASVELISLLARFAITSRRHLVASLINTVSPTAGMTLAFQLSSRFEIMWQGVVAAGLTVAASGAMGRLVIHYYNKGSRNAQTDRA